ncbi:Transposase [Andreprevotia lacus DSM 23236]|jgi:transposase|uniref:Transposase n=1 Tax=Andreprevotia lacus DSM 23236 TaxID=1121001 RepID=A0A1W1Y1E1_9NEIS|nr:IS110 family transposase [Andreprevotia lacus]SMC28623.1 Transposase [Andreprevotia lacus DSM 23236]SMC29966.1 Transposase [Andreprevotia lacus DSM 23236]
MNDLRCFIGIDVAKLKLDLALLVNGKYKSKVVPNTREGHQQLQQWLLDRDATPTNSHLCMEATGPYSETVATALADRGWPVSIVNPARIKGFAQSELSRNKTDSVDAALLARFCSVMQPECWTPPPAEYRTLRAWVDRLQALKDIQQQEKNRQEAALAMQQAALVDSIQHHLDWLAQEIARIAQDIDDHLDHHPGLKRDAMLMTSIPGIGNTTAAKMLAYVGDVRRFESAKALAAWLGVSPRQRQSGSSVRGRTMLSRAGHRSARTALYMPALVALRHNPALQAFGERLRANGLAPKAVVGAAMRKLAHLIFGVVRSGMPFNAEMAMPRLDLQDGI